VRAFFGSWHKELPKFEKATSVSLALKYKMPRVVRISVFSGECCSASLYISIAAWKSCVREKTCMDQQQMT